MAVCFVCSIFDWTHKNLENEAFLLVAVHRVCMWRYFQCFCHQQMWRCVYITALPIEVFVKGRTVLYQDATFKMWLATWLLLHEVVAPPPVWYWLKHIWVFVTSDLPLQARFSRPACPAQLVQPSLSSPASPGQLLHARPASPCQASFSRPASLGQLLHGNFSRPGQLLQVRPAFSGLPLNWEILFTGCSNSQHKLCW